MDAVSGEYNNRSRASRSVAQIATPSRAPIPASRDATGHTTKRKAVDDDPATRVMREINTMPESTPVSDQADVHSKRVKLNAETELAFTLLKENPLEQRLDVQLPYEKFLQLDEAFSELKSAAGISEDQRYPSLAYNSYTETVTVVTAPSSINEGAARWIDSKIFAFIEEYLSTRSQHTLQYIRQVGSTTKHFTGGYMRSRKEPDGGFIYVRMDGEDKLLIALEVGYSEVYDKLLDDKDMWIDGKGANAVILVCLKERPRYKSPATAPYRDITDWRAEMAAMSRTIGETSQSNIQQGYYGLLGYNGHTWAGELNEVFIEVWRPDSRDKFYLIQDGLRLPVDDLPVTLGLRMRDLYPRDEWEAANVEDCIIPFDSAGFLENLRFGIITASKDRFQGFLFEVLGL
ncbi:hypothetical protein V1508DRAFT_405764 [Lipomyces doorenjongii]|uniref:uncharacterized protein n=1 Tax=Lipomyces doorenjongii TaxID=383834 RepID=UPI0034CD7A29